VVRGTSKVGRDPTLSERVILSGWAATVGVFFLKKVNGEYTSRKKKGEVRKSGSSRDVVSARRDRAVAFTETRV
jgi:hypothetical protein